MFNQYTEQFQTFLTPANTLFSANAKALEKLAQLQTELFTAVLEDGVTYVQSVCETKDIGGIFEAQKKYAESLQEKMLSATRDACSVVAVSEEEASEILQGTFARVPETTADAASTAH